MTTKIAHDCMCVTVPCTCEPEWPIDPELCYDPRPASYECPHCRCIFNQQALDLDGQGRFCPECGQTLESPPSHRSEGEASVTWERTMETRGR